jgi:Cys-tRNA synthase (O-phospho-L-seryl-tRNA:Cys-tRNA synthase)
MKMVTKPKLSSRLVPRSTSLNQTNELSDKSLGTFVVIQTSKAIWASTSAPISKQSIKANMLRWNVEQWARKMKNEQSILTAGGTQKGPETTLLLSNRSRRRRVKKWTQFVTASS